MDNLVPPWPRQRWWLRLRLVGVVVLALLAYGALSLLDPPSGGLNSLLAWVRGLIAVLVIVGLYEIIRGGRDDNVLWSREMPGSEAGHARWWRMLGAILGLGLLGLLAIRLAGAMTGLLVLAILILSTARRMEQKRQRGPDSGGGDAGYPGSYGSEGSCVDTGPGDGCADAGGGDGGGDGD